VKHSESLFDQSKTIHCEPAAETTPRPFCVSRVFPRQVVSDGAADGRIEIGRGQARGLPPGHAGRRKVLPGLQGLSPALQRPNPDVAQECHEVAPPAGVRQLSVIGQDCPSPRARQEVGAEPVMRRDRELSTRAKLPLRFRQHDKRKLNGACRGDDAEPGSVGLPYTSGGDRD